MSDLTEIYGVGTERVTVSFTGPTERFATSGQFQSPRTSSDLVGGGSGSSLLIRPRFVQTNDPSFPERLTVNFAFGHAGWVSNLRFKVFDVDTTTNGIDRVWALASTGSSCGSVTVIPSRVIAGTANGLTTFVGDSGPAAVTGTAASSTLESDGTATFEFGQTGIGCLTLQIWNLSDAATLAFTDIAIGDISFDATDPTDYRLDWDDATWTPQGSLSQSYTVGATASGSMWAAPPAGWTTQRPSCSAAITAACAAKCLPCLPVLTRPRARTWR